MNKIMMASALALLLGACSESPRAGAESVVAPGTTAVAEQNNSSCRYAGFGLAVCPTGPTSPR